MSFGFSVSDFIALGALVLKLYDEFKEAPGACQAFAHELLLFHRILEKLGFELEGNVGHLENSDYAALKACADSCKELIYVQIYNSADVPSDIPSFEHFWQFTSNPQLETSGLLRRWRQRWADRKFAVRIPKIQRAVAAHIQSLTAFYTLIIRYDQLRAFACQDRLEALHEQTRAYLEDKYETFENSQNRLEAASERVERSQARMERRLQSILAFQQKRESPILSQSLDASSPEGRETWMKLGRLLRAEGVTPAMIKQNHEILVKAIKTTLQRAEPSCTPDSYYTAFESLSSHHRAFTDPSGSRLSAQASIGILGSAPPRGATFTEEFLERHKGAATSLEQDANVQDGLNSLLQGMGTSEISDERPEVDDDIDLDGLLDVHPTAN